MAPESLWENWNEQQRYSAESQLSETIIGEASKVAHGLKHLATRTSADELLVQAQIFDHAARIRSHEIVVEALEK